MLEYIKKCFKETEIEVLTKVPETKKIFHAVNIDNVPPTEVVNFMGERDIPPTAYFSTVKVDEGLGMITYPSLNYYTEEETTAKDREGYISRTFNHRVMSNTRKLLRENGYKTIPVKTDDLDQFSGMDDYTLYKAGKWDTIEALYFLYFAKEEAT